MIEKMMQGMDHRLVELLHMGLTYLCMEVAHITKAMAMAGPVGASTTHGNDIPWSVYQNSNRSILR